MLVTFFISDTNLDVIWWMGLILPREMELSCFSQYHQGVILEKIVVDVN